MENKIDTILFDLGNVLLPFDWERAVLGFADLLKRDPSDIRKILSHPDYSIFFYEFGTGRISTARFVKQLNGFLRCKLDLESITSVWCSIFDEDRPMTGLLRKLSRHFRTFIVSDTDCLHWDYVNRRYRLEEAVRGTILSFRRGGIKTDPGCFQKIVVDYKFAPPRTLLIDDLKKNIQAAEQAGIRGLIHASYAETLERLKNLGVAPGS